MSLALDKTYRPMEAELVATMPSDGGWQYEPKWDGFRCLVFRDANDIALRSKKGQPLERYFPELVEAVAAVAARRFVLDAEIVVPVGAHLSFDDLLQRIHPAESRIRRLAAERPAMLIAFDLLVDEKGHSLVSLPLRERRSKLESFAAEHLAAAPSIRLSPATTDRKSAEKWLRGAGDAVDGIVAKRLDDSYRSGERAMRKIKLERTADCVVGGFRYASGAKVVGSLLLGLYDDDGLLHHVGFCSGFRAAARLELIESLKPLMQPPGFTGRAPGGPSRWSTERTTEWEPLAPKLVVEVRYDHFNGGRFRHGTGFVRWRPDKPPRECTLAQVASEARIAPMQLLDKPRRRAAKRVAKARPQPTAKARPRTAAKARSQRKRHGAAR